jgi:hypothetical protein
MLDKEKMLRVLERYAQDQGMRYHRPSEEDLAVFGCTTYEELYEALWNVTRLLREHKRAQDAEAGMVMLDLHGDEQPTKKFAHREHDAQIMAPGGSWKNGLFDLVAYFEHVTTAALR